MWSRLFVFNIYQDNANKLCHPLFITHIFRGGETPQSKKQPTKQMTIICKPLLFSGVYLFVSL